MKKDNDQLPSSYFRICAHLTSSSNIINTLRKNGNLIMVSLKDPKFQLCDTSYAVQVEVSTVDENGSIVKSNAMTTQENVWSNSVNIN